jgi:hypothetical protein
MLRNDACFSVPMDLACTKRSRGCPDSLSNIGLTHALLLQTVDVLEEASVARVGLGSTRTPRITARLTQDAVVREVVFFADNHNSSPFSSRMRRSKVLILSMICVMESGSASYIRTSSLW